MRSVCFLKNAPQHMCEPSVGRYTCEGKRPLEEPKCQAISRIPFPGDRAVRGVGAEERRFAPRRTPGGGERSFGVVGYFQGGSALPHGLLGWWALNWRKR